MISRWLKPLLTGTALMLGGLGIPVAVQAQKSDQTQMIDEQLKKSWASVDIKPSAPASDYQFARRVFIDLIGRIPSSEEVSTFVNDSSSNKRQRLVKRLLTENSYKLPIKVDGKEKVIHYSDEYAHHWSNVWTVWLMTRGGLIQQHHDSLAFWMETELQNNLSYDKLVRKLITATGRSNDNGAVNFILSHMGEKTPAEKSITDGPYEMVPLTSRVTKLFLGIQTQCTQCHDHPFNPEWGQENFWGVNAFFRQVTRDKMPTLKTQNQAKVVYVPVTISDDQSANKSGTVYYEKRSGVLVSSKPTFLPNLSELDKEKADRKEKVLNVSESAGKSRRELAADFIIDHDNFAKAYVNRVWAQLFGRGLNETATYDDFGNHNKLVHPELLEKLGNAFKTYGYDSKMLLEWICTSDAYSLSYVANETNKSPDKEAYFSRMLLKAMSPEVLFESLMEATKSEGAMNRDERTGLKKAWQSKLVNNFGDDEGNEVSFNGTIVQALLMMNGKEMTAALTRQGSSAVDKATAKYKNDGSIINELYLSALGRPMSNLDNVPILDKKSGKPTGSFTRETTFVMAALADAKKSGRTKEFFNDLFWSLLNTNEFILNH